MKVAIPSTNGVIGGPGEASEVLIYEISSGAKFLEKYPNPALTAPGSPGMWMLRSVVEHGAECMIVSGVGEHVFNAAKGRVKIYRAEGMSVEDAVNLLEGGKLPELLTPGHGHHHHH